MQFSVVVDRSEGASSLVDGQFEVMLQRRLLDTQDSGRKRKQKRFQKEISKNSKNSSKFPFEIAVVFIFTFL